MKAEDGRVFNTRDEREAISKGSSVLDRSVWERRLRLEELSDLGHDMWPDRPSAPEIAAWATQMAVPGAARLGGEE